MNEHRYTVLCVDDEENILSALKRLLRGEDYTVITVTSGAEGLKFLEENDVHLIISDQKMPVMSGTEFFSIVRERFPEAVRVILSGYTDVDTITDSINKGHIYKFLLKPWHDETLKLEVNRALEYYELRHANKLLYEKVLEQNNELRDINNKLEHMVRMRTEELEIKNQVLELAREILENLPFPTIGVSEEGTIVLTNRQAQRLSFAGRTITVGDEFSDYFQNGLMDIVNGCIKFGESRSVKDCLIGGDAYNIDFTPLLGKFRGRGVVLSLRSSKQLGLGTI